ncbi:hypothetical protein AALO_G00189220 [Alosa alosa]|uniref:Uncharacterized protein n=1 Tax=Alosa alosa TaxID=278164 RepID=A0AAV6G9Q8_9TELE|nr:hypothetical protein AALO_G00189220 [Alosa alosa]
MSQTELLQCHGTARPTGGPRDHHNSATCSRKASAPRLPLPELAVPRQLLTDETGQAIKHLSAPSLRQKLQKLLKRVTNVLMRSRLVQHEINTEVALVGCKVDKQKKWRRQASSSPAADLRPQCWSSQTRTHCSS